MNAISKAAANGAVSREMHDLRGTPDFEVHHSTVVDHRGHPFLPPAVIGQETSVIENTPRSGTVSNDNRASVILGYEPATVVSNGGSQEILHKKAGVTAPKNDVVAVSSSRPVTTIMADKNPNANNAKQTKDEK